MATNNIFRRGIKSVSIGTGKCDVWCVVCGGPLVGGVSLVSSWVTVTQDCATYEPHNTVPCNSTASQITTPYIFRNTAYSIMTQEARQNCTKPSTSCDAGHTCARLLTTMSEQTNIACGVLQMRRWFDLTRAFAGIGRNVKVSNQRESKGRVPIVCC